MNAPIFRFNDTEEKSFSKGIVKSIGEVFVERSERGKPDLPLLAVTIGKGVTKRDDLTMRDNSSSNKDNYKVVHENDIAYNSMRMWQGASGRSLNHGIISPAYTVLQPKEGVYSLYFAYLFKTSSMLKKFQRYSQGMTSDTWNLKYPALSKIKVKVPSLEEQKKVADFFTMIDYRINMQEEKVRILKEQKKGIFQKVFSGELKFENQNGDPFLKWETKYIKDIFKERSERGKPDLPLLAVTINSGVTNRKELALRDNSSSNKDLYKVVYEGDIAYNSMRMWQGASGCSPYHGLISPAYTVLEPEKYVNSLYFAYLFKTIPVIQTFQRYSQGMTSDTWNLKYPALSKIKVTVPSFEEQGKISEFLSLVDQKIKNEEQMLEILKEQKNSLMEQILV